MRSGKSKPRGTAPDRNKAAIDEILARVNRGDEQAIGSLVSLLHDELHSLAHRRLQQYRPGQTLNTTALIHEAYVQLAGGGTRRWNDRSHFLGAAATAMRFIIIDYARRRAAQKRGGDLQPIRLESGEIPVLDRAPELLALDDALAQLSRLDERLGRVVELRFFGGLTVPETASVMGASESTVKRNWRKATILLRELLREGDGR